MLRRSIALAAVLAATAVLTSGCSGTTAEATRSVAETQTPTFTPFVTPTAVAGEVTRSVLDTGGVREPAGAMPATGEIAVDVACSGADGSMMRWSLVAGDGKPLGLTGEADCSGPPSTSWLGITATKRPSKVSVTLTPASGVVSGYAIVRRGTP